jgi:hypothetical protein
MRRCRHVHRLTGIAGLAGAGELSTPQGRGPVAATTQSCTTCDKGPNHTCPYLDRHLLREGAYSNHD